MGAKQTKDVGCNLPDAPPPTSQSYTFDPSSQTPHIDPQQEMPVLITEKPLGALRKRVCTYSLSDPRSPNVGLNRTPLVFDDAEDKMPNLDYSFVACFVESLPADNDNMQDKNVPSHETAANSSSIEIVSLECDEETQLCSSLLQRTPVSMQQNIDPRSPSIGLERTPIIFSDDDEATENEVLENILATLSLNLSNASSVINSETPTLTNKHLNRVLQVDKKRPHKPLKTTRLLRPRVYKKRSKDIENAISICTPKQKSAIESPSKRTPLSCLKNHSHLRSREYSTDEGTSISFQI